MQTAKHWSIKKRKNKRSKEFNNKYQCCDINFTTKQQQHACSANSRDRVVSERELYAGQNKTNKQSMIFRHTQTHTACHAEKHRLCAAESDKSKCNKWAYSMAVVWMSAAAVDAGNATVTAVKLFLLFLLSFFSQLIIDTSEYYCNLTHTDCCLTCVVQ